MSVRSRLSHTAKANIPLLRRTVSSTPQRLIASTSTSVSE